MANERREKGRQEPKTPGTRTLDAGLTDSAATFATALEEDYKTSLERLWQANPDIHRILQEAPDREAARDAVYACLEKSERAIFQTHSDLHILEKATVRDCITVFRSIIGPINELRTEVSALDCLWRLARGMPGKPGQEASVGFLVEFANLFRGVAGKANIYLELSNEKEGHQDFLTLDGREAADAQTKMLDEMAEEVRRHFDRYPSGLDRDVVSRRRENRERILKYFGATEEDWNDYHWQLAHVIRDAAPLAALIELSEQQRLAVEKAAECRIPFGITPYYLSLMDRDPAAGHDHAVRAQVIPPPDYVDMMARHRHDRDTTFDFMGEHDTSPVDLVTRRYPCIAILKPFNTCSQICVYCQRNWEIDEVLAPDAEASQDRLEQALAWLDEHPGVGEVLITGGDPCVMREDSLAQIIDALAAKEHVYRIRIGTRTPVVLPMRWTDSLLRILAEANEPGRREIAVVTHFEHSYEVTPQATEAVHRIRRAGMSVYNQQVFTVENSRRFESARLRRDLRLIGVDPYYTFNMKGKRETRRYMAPVARIMQERKEEARLLPGLDRTDEPVFNVPRLGKNHLRAGQDRRLVMIRPDGCRVYEFHPWEKNITALAPYYYVDIPIYDYLKRLAARGE
ncbi:MAG: KamA family radical SAM protein, partial [Phycisphaerales bacterium]